MSLNNFKTKLSFKLAVVIMFTSLLGVSVIAYISFLQSKEIFNEKNLSTIETDLEKYTSNILDSIGSLKQDISMLSKNKTVKGIMRAYHGKYHYDEVQNKTFIEYENEIKSLFMLMLKQNPSYFQVRILDSYTGQELVRLDRKNDKIIITPSNKLQNKLKRSYTQGAIKAKGGMYISRLNLNREFGNIEFPIVPTLRVAKMTSSDISKSGIIVININVNKLLNFNKSRQNKNIKTYIANQEGYYLLNTVNPSKEFGFEFNNNYRIYDDFKEIKEFFNEDKENYLISNANFILQAKKLYLESGRFVVLVKHTTDSLFDKNENKYFIKLLSYIFAIVLFIAIITAVTVKKFTSPIIKLKTIANQIAKAKGEKLIKIDINTEDEIGELANSFDTMLQALHESKQEIREFANRLEIEVDKKTKELKKANESLQKNVDEKLSEIRKKDQALLQQNKMAAIGETIGAIAHQWRQPLNSLGLNIQMLVDMAEDKKCSVEEIEEFVENNMKTIQFMSQTIDDFRNFFRDSREKSDFDIKEAINSTISLQKEQIKSHNIKILTKLESIKFNGYKNKFMQVILNLISNAKDAIIEKREIERDFNGYISIEAFKENKQIVIEISDNGIDIPKDIEQKIFEPYFTTKEQGKGTGMGLYMSKEIISSMNGDMTYVNIDGKKKFIINFKGVQND